MARFLLSAVALMLVFAPAGCTDPGMKARLTQRGLDYVNQLMVDRITQDVRLVKIPDQSGSTFGLDYTVKNIRVERFTVADSRLALRPGIGLHWSTSTTSLSLSAEWSYTSIFATHSGTMTAEVDGVFISFLLKMGKDSRGWPTVALRTCSDATQTVSIDFRGDVTVIMQLFQNMIESMFQDKLKGQFCSGVQTAINTNVTEMLRNIPMTMTVLEKFLVDMRLVSAPTFASSFLETKQKGEVMWKDDPQEAPFPPPSEGPQLGGDRMLYLSLSAFTGNSMAWAAFSHHFLQYHLSQSQLPPASRGVLNTSCPHVCIGKLIHQIGDKYPNTSVSLAIRATESPTLTLTSDRIHLVAEGNVDMMAEQPGDKQAFLLSLNVSLQMNATAALNDTLLLGKVESARARVAVVRSAVGEVKTQILQDLMDMALKGIIVPELNKWAAQGRRMPVPLDLHFVEPRLLMREDFLVVATDVVVKRTSSQRSQGDNRVMQELSPLIFLPQAHPEHEVHYQ